MKALPGISSGVVREVARPGKPVVLAEFGWYGGGKPKFDRGDRVKVKDGIFIGMEGEVKELNEAKGTVKVELTIFGRPTSVELEYWQVENL